MNRIQNLIATARLVGEIQQGVPQTNTEPTGLIDPATTDAPPIFVNLYNDLQADKANLSDSDATVTLHQMVTGRSQKTRLYFKRSEAFRRVIGILENHLTPLPSQSQKDAIVALVAKITPLLKACSTCSTKIAESLKAIKAEVDRS